MIFLAEYRGELVHDAAFDAAVIVLGRLTDAGEFEFVYFVVVEEVVERECKYAFERSRRRKACAKRYIAREDGVKPFDCASAFDDLTAHTEYIAGPLLFGGVFFVEAEFDIIVDIDRKYPDLVSAVGLDLGHDAFVDSSGENKSAVVVGVLAYEVDSA